MVTRQCLRCAAPWDRISSPFLNVFFLTSLLRSILFNSHTHTQPHGQGQGPSLDTITSPVTPLDKQARISSTLTKSLFGTLRNQLLRLSSSFFTFTFSKLISCRITLFPFKTETYKASTPATGLWVTKRGRYGLVQLQFAEKCYSL